MIDSQIAATEVHRNPWFSVVRLEARGRDWFQIVAPDSCIVIGLFEKQVVLVQGTRVSDDAEQVIELPGGICDPGEVPETTARREFEEECGLQLGELTKVGSFRQSPAVSAARCHVFTAIALQGHGQSSVLDGGEDWVVKTLPPMQLRRAITEGRITDGPSLAALQLWGQL